VRARKLLTDPKRGQGVLDNPTSVTNLACSQRTDSGTGGPDGQRPLEELDQPKDAERWKGLR